MIGCYADDLKVYGIPVAPIQNDLDTILSWSNINKLSINGKKCEVLHLGKTSLKYGYSINNNSLNAKSSIRDLGIQIDENLTFLPRQKPTLKCTRLINIFFKLVTGKNVIFSKIFDTYILPQIDYCSILFYSVSKKGTATIERIQKLFTRKLFKQINNSNIMPPYKTFTYKH